jgi:hypothetical protein
MPSNLNSAFVDPKLVAQIVRKSELITEEQILKALVALGLSPAGLQKKVRVALERLLRSANPEFCARSVTGHPAAIDSWQKLPYVPNSRPLTWERSFAFEDSISENSALRLIQNCERAKLRGYSSVNVILHLSRKLTNQLVDEDPAFTTGLILRTSVWTKLLTQDAKAANSWQIIDCPPDVSTNCCAATYRNSHAETVLVLAVFGNHLAIRRSLKHMDNLANQRRWKLELYSLFFPTLERRIDAMGPSLADITFRAKPALIKILYPRGYRKKKTPRRA